MDRQNIFQVAKKNTEIYDDQIRFQSILNSKRREYAKNQLKRHRIYGSNINELVKSQNIFIHNTHTCILHRRDDYGRIRYSYYSFKDGKKLNKKIDDGIRYRWQGNDLMHSRISSYTSNLSLLIRSRAKPKKSRASEIRKRIKLLKKVEEYNFLRRWIK